MTTYAFGEWAPQKSPCVAVIWQHLFFPFITKAQCFRSITTQ